MPNLCCGSFEYWTEDVHVDVLEWVSRRERLDKSCGRYMVMAVDCASLGRE